MTLPVPAATTAERVDAVFEANALLARARAAQPRWEEIGVGERLRCVARFRALLAEEGEALAALCRPRGRSGNVETLTSEVLPLAEACRFLETFAEEILATRRPRPAARPPWLRRSSVRIARKPLGVVLILGPANYPLFLPAVQALQALVAGNAVLIKPGLGGRPVAQELVSLLRRAGLNPDLCAVLDETPAAAQRLIARGVDKVLLTGSAQTGRAVLGSLAPQLTPATLELSGCDAVFVLEDADVDLTARALAFGLMLNGGATCIAPRRVFVPRRLSASLANEVRSHLAGQPPVPVGRDVARRVEELVTEAVLGGASVLGRLPRGGLMEPVILLDVRPGTRVLAEDLFAPLLSFVPAEGPEEALSLDGRCPYALGAAVFGGERRACLLARELRAGVVVVNDVIVPTADPRVPFGGAGESGFGVTRGAEGLLELTRPQSLIVRRGGRMHLREQPGNGQAIFLAYLRAAHGGSLVERLRGVGALAGAVWRNATGPGKGKGS